MKYMPTMVAVAFFAMSACRADPGTGDYSSHEGLRDSNTSSFLPGPVPFVPTVPRLALGGFYEPVGGERVLAENGVDIFYFIFDTAGDGSGQFTYEQETSSDRVQGALSDRLTLSGAGFWGGGFFWFTARDISNFTTLNVSFKASAAALADITIAVESGRDRPPMGVGDQTTVATVNAADYGYVNDGEWHSITIPISDFEAQGFDPSSVRVPVRWGGEASDGGETLLVDDLYFQ